MAARARADAEEHQPGAGDPRSGGPSCHSQRQACRPRAEVVENPGPGNDQHVDAAEMPHGKRPTRGLTDRFPHELTNAASLGPTAETTAAVDRHSRHAMPARINEGLRLLRSSNVARDSTVLTMALTDPFTYARGGRHAEHTPLWWDLYYSFSAAQHPASRKLFADVDYVMEPVLRPTDAGCCKSTIAEMLALYGGYLKTHYAAVARSPDWTLLKRRAGSTTRQ